MTVGIRLGSITDEIGSSSFFFSFFSTISANLESDGWGTRFPVIMNKLYHGKIEEGNAEQALDEIQKITLELSKIPVENIVWDIENKSHRPPWGDNISPHITDLSNYFVTSTGRDLIKTLKEIFEEQRDRGGEITVVEY